MLDEFRVKKPAGFPDHPHRGMETVTFVHPESEGSMSHEDSVGHAGTIGPGDLQWMTAGRGILHAEIPQGPGECWGLQLWVNLPKAEKMKAPAYSELLTSEIPKVTKEGVTAWVIAGEAMGVKSPVRNTTPTHYAFFLVSPSSSFSERIPEGWNVFAYVMRGEVECDGQRVKAHHTIVFGKEGGEVSFSNPSPGSEEGGRAEVVLIAGKPLGEPVSQRGPFVMNTAKEIAETIADYQNARNGFESVEGWESRIAKAV